MNDVELPPQFGLWDARCLEKPGSTGIEERKVVRMEHELRRIAVAAFDAISRGKTSPADAAAADAVVS